MPTIVANFDSRIRKTNAERIESLLREDDLLGIKALLTHSDDLLQQLMPPAGPISQVQVDYDVAGKGGFNEGLVRVRYERGFGYRSAFDVRKGSRQLETALVRRYCDWQKGN